MHLGTVAGKISVSKSHAGSNFTLYKNYYLYLIWSKQGRDFDSIKSFIYYPPIKLMIIVMVSWNSLYNIATLSSLKTDALCCHKK